MITNFEDIIAWQKARQVTAEIYRVTRQEGFAKDFGLKDQVRRAAVSVMANIAEGHERACPGDFGRFLAIAKASCAELRSHLYVALDAQYVDEETFQRLRDSIVELGRVIGGLRTAVIKRHET